MKIVKRGMVGNAGATSIAGTIPPANGQIVARYLAYTSPAAGTLKFYRPKQKTTAHAAATASSTLVVHTDSSGYVGGAVLTTSDYVLVCSTTGTVWTLQSISSVAAVSSSTVSLGLGGNVTCLAGDTIFIVRAADIITWVTAAETIRAEYPANGDRNMPMHVVMAATGTNYFGIAYDIED